VQVGTIFFEQLVSERVHLAFCCLGILQFPLLIYSFNQYTSTLQKKSASHLCVVVTNADTVSIAAGINGSFSSLPVLPTSVVVSALAAAARVF
jgi:hypothetical protein